MSEEHDIEVACVEIVNFSNALYLRLRDIFAIAYKNRKSATSVQEAVRAAVMRFMGREAPNPFCFATHDCVSPIVNWLIHYYAENISEELDEESTGPIREWADKLFPDPRVDPRIDPRVDTLPISEEEAMSIKTPVVVTRTYVLDQDVATMSDDQLYQAIATVGVEIERLEKVAPKPQKLVAKIAELQAQQQAIVELVDARP